MSGISIDVNPVFLKEVGQHYVAHCLRFEEENELSLEDKFAYLTKSKSRTVRRFFEFVKRITHYNHIYKQAPFSDSRIDIEKWLHDMQADLPLSSLLNIGFKEDGSDSTNELKEFFQTVNQMRTYLLSNGEDHDQIRLTELATNMFNGNYYLNSNFLKQLPKDLKEVMDKRKDTVNSLYTAWHHDFQTQAQYALFYLATVFIGVKLFSEWCQTKRPRYTV